MVLAPAKTKTLNNSYMHIYIYNPQSYKVIDEKTEHIVLSGATITVIRINIPLAEPYNSLHDRKIFGYYHESPLPFHESQFL